MLTPDWTNDAVFKNFIDDHRLKSTESTVYLNNRVEDGPFHTDPLVISRGRSIYCSFI